MVKLRFRPHHFLCMLTYVGKGYTDKFTDNFNALIDTINTQDAVATLVEGADDICAPRLCDTADVTCHCHDDDKKQIDKQALDDFSKIPVLSHVLHGAEVKLTESLISELRHAYKSGAIRTACQGCEWKSLCDTITEQNFIGTKLK